MRGQKKVSKEKAAHIPLVHSAHPCASPCGCDACKSAILPEVGNGTLAAKTGHNWIGRGLIQMTHSAPYKAFANYIQSSHPELIAVAQDKVAETLLADTKQIIDIENNPNSRMLAALSGAWYWSKWTTSGGTPSTVSINKEADVLNFTNPIPATEQGAFNNVSTRVGNAAHDVRWIIYKDKVAPEILKGGNPYETMSSALNQLGITTTGTEGYAAKIGVSLAKRTAMKIEGGTHSLMADMSAPELLYPDNMPTLLAQAQKTLNFKEGEFTVWIPDLATQPIEQPAIYLVANNSQTVQAAGTVTPHKLGVCESIYGPTDIHPASNAGTYTSQYMNQNFDTNPDGSERTDISIRIIEPPKHGRLIQENPDATDYIRNFYQYIPDAGYLGFDYFVTEAKTGDNTVQIYYTMSVLDPEEPRYSVQDDGKVVPYDAASCPQEHWKISIAPNATSTDGAYSIILPSAFSGNDYPSPTITFVNLPGAAVGETKVSGAAATITFDTDAAGYGWFIDGTPTLNEEFLPTSTPYEWVAKADSAAAGKMDMLSVWLHEFASFPRRRVGTRAVGTISVSVIVRMSTSFPNSSLGTTLSGTGFINPSQAFQTDLQPRQTLRTD